MDNQRELTPADKALRKIVTKEYTLEFINAFKALAKMTDEIINGEYDDEEDVVGTNALDVPCYAIHNQGFFKGYDAAKSDYQPTWISCDVELPNPEEHEKVLIHTISPGPNNQNKITIVDTSIVKHYKKEETRWMPLPKL